MFSAYQASMNWQIETADFNISENSRMIMSTEERVKKKGKKKLEHFLEIKAQE